MNKLPETIEVTTDASVLDTVFDNFLGWYDRYEEMAQGRTNFQIEKFIAVEDSTPCHSYVNTLHQTRIMRGELLREVREGIEMSRTFEWKWKDKDKKEPVQWPSGINGTNKLCWYDTDHMEFKHRILELGLSIKDKLQQLSLFDLILNKMVELNGGEFTREQYLNEAPVYWQTRFAKQIADDVVQAKTGINTGNIRSLRLAMEDTLLNGSPNKVENFPDIFNALISGDPTKVKNSMNELMDIIDIQAINIRKGNNLLASPTKKEIPPQIGEIEE